MADLRGNARDGDQAEISTQQLLADLDDQEQEPMSEEEEKKEEQTDTQIVSQLLYDFAQSTRHNSSYISTQQLLNDLA